MLVSSDRIGRERSEASNWLAAVRCVSEAFLHRLRMHALGEQERGAGVPRVGVPGRRHAGRVDRPAEPDREAVRVDRPARLASGDEPANADTDSTARPGVADLGREP